MKINFVSYSNIQMASFRYRTLIPARSLTGMGHKVGIIREEDSMTPGIYIFSKHFNPKVESDLVDRLQDPGFVAANVTSARAGETDPNIIVYDVCDNHFDKPIMDGVDSPDGYYKHMCEKADMVVAATETLAGVVKAHTGLDAHVIPDSYEFPEHRPRFNWEQWTGINLLWFGHPVNLKQLQRVWNELEGHNIMVITGGDVKLEVDGKPFPIIPWSLDSMLWGFSQCDLTIIPCDEESRCKGANRMIESIRQGVFVVAEPMPAYEEFKEWMYIGNIKEGLRWVKENKQSLQKRIEDAQDYVRKKFAPEVIAEQWQSSLQRITAEKSAKTGTSCLPRKKESALAGKA
tara:strand:+ start:1102 stop:2139 length:1038 start_codon:yes stop_codon:yes gene_type:complete